MGTLEQSDRSQSFGSRLLMEVQESTLLKVVVTGTLFVAFAVAIEVAIQLAFLSRGLVSVWATFLLIWGLGILLTGTAGRVFIWWRRQ